MESLVIPKKTSNSGSLIDSLRVGIPTRVPVQLNRSVPGPGTAVQVLIHSSAPTSRTGDTYKRPGTKFDSTVLILSVLSQLHTAAYEHNGTPGISFQILP
eukprot:3941976-Rhodomonas_salina.11